MSVAYEAFTFKDTWGAAIGDELHGVQARAKQYGSVWKQTSRIISEPPKFGGEV